MMCRCEADTRAAGIPCAASVLSSRSAPGISGTPPSSRSTKRRLMSTVSSAGERSTPVLASRWSMTRVIGPPTTWARSSAVSSWPSSAKSEASACHQKSSVSTSVPSMSSSTACRPRSSSPRPRVGVAVEMVVIGGILPSVPGSDPGMAQAGPLLSGPARSGSSRIRPGTPNEANAAQRGHYRALKYLASGWWITIASVDCSGCSWNSSESTTPIRSGFSRSAILARSSSSGQAP